MRILFFSLLIVLLTSFSAAAQSWDDNLSENQKITLGLFEKGCLKHSKDREAWANSQQALNKAEIQDANGLTEMVKKLGYPENDRVLNMWAIYNHYIFIYDFENFGCMVTSDDYIQPEFIQLFMEHVKTGQEKVTRKKITITSKPDAGNYMSLLTFAHKKGKVSPYILVNTRESSENEQNKTILYFFQTKKDVSF